jgi:beta-glucanase (GH16 family)
MRKLILAACLLAGLASCANNEKAPLSTPATEADSRRLVWADEFEQEGAPDAARWGYDLADGCPEVCGWGNNELQYYTQRPENVRIEDGKLIIEAHWEPYEGKEYTSTRLVSREKGDWKYGYIEARAKLPQGTGTWPAIWMLPTDWQYGGWPASGEIDIMEHVGYNQGMVHGTVHTKAFNHSIGTQKGDSIMVPDVHEQFHVYAIDWSPEKIDFMVDGTVYNTFTNEDTGHEAWPFDQPFHLLLNLAVGGNWGGAKGVDEKIWPQRMEVDYVRVYEQTE